MKRLVLAGVLALAALLGSESKARAMGWGRDGIALSFGVRISYWYDASKSHHSNCYGPACYAPPVVGGAYPYLADHSWAYSGPFTTPGTFVGYGAYGATRAHPVSTTGYGASGYGASGMMVGQNYGYDYGSGYGYAY